MPDHSLTDDPEKVQTPALRIWSEFVPYETLCSSKILDLLRPYPVQVLLAVTPGKIAELPRVIRGFSEAKLPLGLWPMVSDREGRWASTANAQVFSDFLLEVLDSYESLSTEKTTVAIDLEPPITLVRSILQGNPKAMKNLLQMDNWHQGLPVLQRLIDEIHRRGHQSLAAVSPLLLADGAKNSAWQWLLGTPIRDLSLGHISFMAYTSLLQGYSRSLIDRPTALAMLSSTSVSARAHWRGRASISLGTVGVGALGDENPYRSASELADDVAIVRGAGVKDIALFDLSGVLAQPSPSAWLRVFSAEPDGNPPPVPHNIRALLAKTALKRGGTLINWHRRTRLRL